MRKQQSPQDILNEILLRMNYDSSKTLSENEKLLKEQSSYAYGSNVGSWMNATEKQGAANDPYEYKKEAGTYYYRKKGSTTNWIATTGAQANAIATKIFGDKAPFVITTQTQTQDPNVYPGPRKTTLSSYSSGDDGQDSDLINSSQFPQYKYKETDNKRQLQSNYYYDLKNKAYQKIIELLRDENTTKDILQRAWNEFMFNYKMLYRDKEQWEDYRTLLKLINNSKKFKLKNGVITLSNPVNTQKQLPAYLNQSSATLSSYLKEREKKIKSLVGEPEPQEPIAPYKDGSDGMAILCPQIYDPNLGATPVIYRYNGKCYRMSEYQEMMTKYNEDYENWLETYSMWRQANPKTGGLSKKIKEIDALYTWRDDVKQQRDTYAGYLDTEIDNRKKAAVSAVIIEFQDWGAKVNEAKSITWKLWLEFRKLWNYFGTQVLMAGIAAAPETFGLTAVGAFMLEIGIDLIVFIIDFINCLFNPDSEDAWDMVVEDTTTLIFYGMFSGLIKLITSKGKIASTFREFLSSISADAKKYLDELFDYAIKKIDEVLPKHPSARDQISWLKNKIKEIKKFIDEFFSSLIGRSKGLWVTNILPTTYFMFLGFTLLEEPIYSTIGEPILKILKISKEELQGILLGTNAPTDEQKKNISKVKSIPQYDIEKYVKEGAEELKDKGKKELDDKYQMAKQKVKEVWQTDPTGSLFLKTEVAKMTGPCKDYLQTLINKNKVIATCAVEVDGKINVYSAVLTINGVKGYYLVVEPTISGIVDQIKDMKNQSIDCATLNSEENTKK